MCIYFLRRAIYMCYKYTHPHTHTHTTIKLQVDVYTKLIYIYIVYIHTKIYNKFYKKWYFGGNVFQVVHMYFIPVDPLSK